MNLYSYEPTNENKMDLYFEIRIVWSIVAKVKLEKLFRLFKLRMFSESVTGIPKILLESYLN